jgi:hypothetical protein
MTDRTMYKPKATDIKKGKFSIILGKVYTIMLMLHSEYSKIFHYFYLYKIIYHPHTLKKILLMYTYFQNTSVPLLHVGCYFALQNHKCHFKDYLSCYILIHQQAGYFNNSEQATIHKTKLKFPTKALGPS